MATTVLPPGPYRIKSGYFTRRYIGGGLLLAISAALAIGVLIWQGYFEAGKLWGEGAIIAHGVQVPASVNGTKKSNHFIFNSYDLRVEYVDQNGGSHHHRLEMESVMSSIDDGVQPTVYYLPDHPDRFVLSWAHSIKGGRWAAIFFFITVGLVMGGGLGLGAMISLRQIGAAQRAAAGHAVEVTCTAVKTILIKGKDKGGRTYHYQGNDASNVEFDGKVVYNLNKGQPLWTDKAESKFVVLCGPGKKDRLVLRNDFYPLDLNAGQLEEFRAHLERRRRGLG